MQVLERLSELRRRGQGLTLGRTSCRRGLTLAKAKAESGLRRKRKSKTRRGGSGACP